MEAEHPQKIGEYDVLGEIGRGAMSRVYKAARPRDKAVVAIKLLPSDLLDDETSVERFHREAEAVALLDHPNVVRLIEKNQEDGRFYFVMEYVPGTPLDAILRQRRLSLPEAIRVFKGACSGLQAAHEKSIVHRDLSPRNILVSDDLSVVKIADFGISRVGAISRDQGTLSTTEFSLGSLHYIAPEQARDMATADHRADIYSLGVLLYEMLTGRVPVGRFNLPSQLNSEVPPEMDPIVLRCLEVDPQKRYPTVAILSREVKRLEDQLRLGLVREVRGIGSQTTRIFLRSTTGRVIRTALIAIGGVSVLAAIVLSLRAFDKQEPPAPAAAESAQASSNGLAQVPEPVGEELAEARADGAPEAGAPPALNRGGPEDLEGPRSAKVSPAGAAKTARPSPASPSVAGAPPTSAGSGEARLAEDLEVSRSKLEAGLLDEAEADLERLIAEFPAAGLTPRAYLLLGEIHERRDQSDKARSTYIELQSRFGESDAAAEGAYRNAKLLQSEKGRDAQRDARLALAAVAEEHPASEWAPKALLDKAALEIDRRWNVDDPELGDRVPAALLTYRSFVAVYPDHPGAELALWRLGEYYADLKEFDLATSALEALAERFPETAYDVWWTAGQLYDRRLDDDQKAVEAYKRVPEGSRHHADAQRRISKLTR